MTLYWSGTIKFNITIVHCKSYKAMYQKIVVEVVLNKQGETTNHNRHTESKKCHYRHHCLDLEARSCYTPYKRPFHHILLIHLAQATFLLFSLFSASIWCFPLRSQLFPYVVGLSAFLAPRARFSDVCWGC